MSESTPQDRCPDCGGPLVGDDRKRGIHAKCPAPLTPEQIAYAAGFATGAKLLRPEEGGEVGAAQTTSDSRIESAAPSGNVASGGSDLASPPEREGERRWQVSPYPSKRSMQYFLSHVSGQPIQVDEVLEVVPASDLEAANERAEDAEKSEARHYQRHQEQFSRAEKLQAELNAANARAEGWKERISDYRLRAEEADRRAKQESADAMKRALAAEKQAEEYREALEDIEGYSTRHAVTSPHIQAMQVRAHDALAAYESQVSREGDAKAR